MRYQAAPQPAAVAPRVPQSQQPARHYTLTATSSKQASDQDLQPARQNAQVTAADLIAELQAYASETQAEVSRRFFKTGPGEYGEGDQFLGVRVPVTRKVCKQYASLPLPELRLLLASPFHEHRLAATIIMSGQYQKADDLHRQHLVELYLQALDDQQINNWDIVDTSCEHIVGARARDGDPKILSRLAHDDRLWHKRTAMISCFAWLRRGELGATLEIVELLWREPHDLLQKAVGWMLRETGKRIDEQLLLDFLGRHAPEMPRTELRYAIERLNPDQRMHWLSRRA